MVAPFRSIGIQHLHAWGVLVIFGLVACGNGKSSDSDDTDVEGVGDDDDAVGDDDDDVTSPTDTGPRPFSFALDVAPIFKSRCNICHYTGSPTNYDFTNPFDPETGIVGRENSWIINGAEQTLVVDPGNPANSSLIVKVSDPNLDTHVDGNPMPYQPLRFTDAEIADVETWIRDGANDDAFYAEKVEPLFGTELTLRKASGRCTWCHYPGNGTGMNVLAVFDSQEGMVNADSAFGGKIVKPGDPANSVLIGKLRGTALGSQMPQHLDRLDEDQIQAIVTWIELGAPDN